MAPENLISRIVRFEQAASEQSPGGVLLVEVDRFRQLRAQLGFRSLFALVRQARARIGEGVAERGEVFRFGLSGFVVVLPGVDVVELQHLASELFDGLSRQVYEVNDESMAISVSMVVARFDHRFAGADRMLVALSERLEKVSSEGGNALSFVEPGVSATLALDSEDHMLGLLMEALQQNRIKVVFQPLLATRADEQKRSFQMLPRLQTSDGELIAAAEFIPIARAARLLPVLDRWMVTHAAKLLRGPLQSQSVRLFINQSDALLTDPARLEWLIATLARVSNSSGKLVVELCLDDAMSHLKRSARLIAGVRENGGAVCFSMVNEHSRWDLLAGALRCDFLRMSPGFVARLSIEPDLEQRFLKLSEPVRERGVRVIMPMIEDQKTAASMWRTGADFMQGNMIQEPEDTIALEE
jgi:EAL domain-containing protein (putative c-di-GMP-specific phosphodiesterase class I)/GGDEF domain-containing protein